MDDARQVIETAPAGDFGELVKVRKFVLHVEEVMHEFGPPADPPLQIGYIAAVAANPYAGRYVEDILPLLEALKPMGMEMAKRLMAALGGADKIVAYGKAAVTLLTGASSLGGPSKTPSKNSSPKKSSLPGYG